jgi:hypothetical protein
MPCLLALLAVFFPRIAIILLYLFTTFFQGVYDTVLVPVLGFIFLPLSLLAYTWLTKSGYPVDAFFLVVMLLAVVIDLGLLGGSEVSRRRRK